MTAPKFDPNDWEQLLILNADDIDYKVLSDDVLEKLALSEEPFIATLALGELGSRRSARAGTVARQILEGTEADRFLRATALRVWSQVDPAAALGYIAKHAGDADPYVVDSMMSVIERNRSEVQMELGQSAVKALVARLRSKPAEAHIPDEHRNDFLKSFGH